MTNDASAWSAEHVIPSERGAGRAIIDEIIVRLAEHQWSSHEQFSVRLALEEAVSNAIRHGNRLDPKKKVRIASRLSRELIVIEVADEGAGFQLEKVPDCTAPENLDKPSGRGLMLIQCYMSRVEYNAAGNAVVMEKRRGEEKRGRGGRNSRRSP